MTSSLMVPLIWNKVLRSLNSSIILTRCRPRQRRPIGHDGVMESWPAPFDMSLIRRLKLLNARACICHLTDSPCECPSSAGSALQRHLSDCPFLCHFNGSLLLFYALGYPYCHSNGPSLFCPSTAWHLSDCPLLSHYNGSPLPPPSVPRLGLSFLSLQW